MAKTNAAFADFVGPRTLLLPRWSLVCSSFPRSQPEGYAGAMSSTGCVSWSVFGCLIFRRGRLIERGGVNSGTGSGEKGDVECSLYPERHILWSAFLFAVLIVVYVADKRKWNHFEPITCCQIKKKLFNTFRVKPGVATPIPHHTVDRNMSLV